MLLIIYNGKVIPHNEIESMESTFGIKVVCPKDSIGNTLIVQGNCFKTNSLKIIYTGNHGIVILGDNINYRGVIRCDDKAFVKIGSNFKSTNSISILARQAKTVIIGNSCLFASNIVVRTSDEHSILNSKNELINPNKNIIIEDRVWCCDNVTILKGSYIGKDVVIGANSTVSGKIGSNSLAVGSPAKVVKSDIHWSYEKPK